MFSPKVLPPTLVALAVMAAFSAPAGAEDITVAPTVALRPAQTWFPAAGMPDPERALSMAAISQIRAEYAYARRITGAGVTIAVVDSGISASHREFAEAGKLAQGFNALTGSTDVTDRAGHGTHVAGIIAGGRDGRGMFGVAYDARLLPIKVLSDSGSGSTTYLDKGIRHAIGKAFIVNASLGAQSRYDPGAMQEAVQAGLLIVAAAGNDRAANPNWPARFAKEAWANNQIIAVGAVDASNRIASFSNRAGDTAAWFLVAPGVRIASAYPADQYMYMSGTSMATPVVSGAAALVKQLWPSLRADQIADILFVTATDLGAPGIDPVYGRGLLNVEKALQPLGPVTTTTVNGRTINVLGSMLRPSAATSQLWKLAAHGKLQVLGFDDYRRDFNIDLGMAVTRPGGLSLDEVFGRMDSRLEVSEQVLADGSRLAVAYDRRVPVAGGLLLNDAGANKARLAAFSFVSQSAGGREAAFGAGGMASNYFGVGGLDLMQANAFEPLPALSGPYLSLVPGASHAAIAQRFGGFKVKLGVLSSGLSQALASQQNLYVQPMSWAAQPKANSALLEISRSFGDAGVALAFSQTREVNAYLGSQSTGALSFGRNAATSAMQLSGALLLAPKLALAGQASYGLTPGIRSDSSLVAEVTGARTNAFSLGLVASDRIKAGDRFSLALSQPMRTYAGHMVMDMLAGVGADGAEMRERVRFSMAPAARELRAELNYEMPAGRDATLRTTFMVRRNPDNMAEAAAEKLLAVRYSKPF